MIEILRSGKRKRGLQALPILSFKSENGQRFYFFNIVQGAIKIKNRVMHQAI